MSTKGQIKHKPFNFIQCPAKYTFLKSKQTGDSIFAILSFGLYNQNIRIQDFNLIVPFQCISVLLIKWQKLYHTFQPCMLEGLQLYFSITIWKKTGLKWFINCHSATENTSKFPCIIPQFLHNAEIISMWQNVLKSLWSHQSKVIFTRISMLQNRMYHLSQSHWATRQVAITSGLEDRLYHLSSSVSMSNQTSCNN